MLKKNKWEALVIFVSIMMSAILISGLGSLVLSANVSKSRYYAELEGDYQYKLKLNQRQKEGLIKYADSHVEKIADYAVTEIVDEGENPLVYSVVKCDENYFNMNHISIKEGKMPTNKNEVAIEQWTANNLNVSLGDFIGEDKKEYKVVAVLSNSSAQIDSSLVYYTFYGEESDAYEVYVNFKNIKNLNKEINRLKKELHLSVRNISVNWDVVEPLGVKPPESDIPIVKWLSKMIDLNEHSLAVILAMFCTIIIYGMLNVVYQKRENDYRVFLQLGIEKNDFIEYLCFEIYMLFVVAFPIGVLIGRIITGKVYSVVISILLPENIAATSFMFSDKAMLTGFISLVILLFIVVLKEAEGIYKSFGGLNDTVKEKYPLRRRYVTNCKKTFTVSLAFNYLMKNKKAYIIVVLSIGLGGAFLVGANYLIDQEYKEVELVRSSDDGLNSDIKLEIQTDRFNIGFSEKDIADIKSIKGVDKVFSANNYYGAVILEKNKIKHQDFFNLENDDYRIKEYFGGVCTEEDDHFLIKGNIYGYSNNLFAEIEKYKIDGCLDPEKLNSENGVVICLPQDGGTHKFDEVDIKPGDYVSIKTPKDISMENETVKLDGDEALYDIKKYKVMATVKRATLSSPYFIGPYGIDFIMTDNQLQKNYGISNYDMVSIQKTNASKSDAVYSQVKKMTEDVDRCIITDYSAVLQKETNNLLQRRIMYDSICWLLIFISVLNMVNTVNYVNRARKRDKEIFSRIGMGHNDFYLLAVTEGAMYGIGAAIIMVVLSLIFIFVIYSYLHRVFYLYMPKYSIDISMVAFSCITCLLIGILTEFLSEKNQNVIKM